tara:strand:- start:77 stop:259 length:183 start_codon:yes stop_codon:yes gene_type:complete
MLDKLNDLADKIQKASDKLKKLVDEEKSRNNNIFVCRIDKSAHSFHSKKDKEKQNELDAS